MRVSLRVRVRVRVRLRVRLRLRLRVKVTVTMRVMEPTRAKQISYGRNARQNTDDGERQNARCTARKSI